MKKVLILLISALLVIAVTTALLLAEFPKKARAGTVIDEAMQAGRTAESLPSSDNDYLRDMDYGITKDPEKVRATLAPYVPGITAEEAVKSVVRGRNNWVIWSAGNDALWDELSRRSVGNIDFLKTLSSHEALPNKRGNRWSYLGLVNEPCFKEATGPRSDRYGLWLDERIESSECSPDPFEDETKYPGIRADL